MSLDTVELVMITEETFGLTIPERDAEKILTVGDLYRYVLDRVSLSDVAGCLSSAQFYRLRRALMESLGVARERVRPAASIDDLISLESRREHWERLGSALGLNLPALRRPEPLRRIFQKSFYVWLASFLVASCVTRIVEPELAPFVAVVSFATGPLLWILALSVTLESAVELPRNCQTVRGLVETLVGLGITLKIPEDLRWSRATVWEAIRAFVAAQAGVPQDMITENTSFVYDLGLD